MPLLGKEKVFSMFEKGKENLNTDLKGVYLSGLSNIISGTPADKGLHRNSWFLSVASPVTSTTSSKDIKGSNSFRQLAQMPKGVLGKKLFFTNNAPAINVLEYGGFPSPVKRGSYIKRSKRFEILSVNGFSKQAPQGWVRVTVLRMANKLRSL